MIRRCYWSRSSALKANIGQISCKAQHTSTDEMRTDQERLVETAQLQKVARPRSARLGLPQFLAFGSNCGEVQLHILQELIPGLDIDEPRSENVLKFGGTVCGEYHICHVALHREICPMFRRNSKGLPLTKSSSEDASFGKALSINNGKNGLNCSFSKCAKSCTSVPFFNAPKMPA